MENKATVPFWSVDAFLFLVMPRGHVSDWSSELISRASTFIDAYILFDKVIVPERYCNETIIKALDPHGVIFEFISSSELIHSDDIRNGISLDLSLNYTDFSVLSSENYKWFSQHHGRISEEDYDAVMSNRPITMAHLRLWQISLLNEIADKTNSVSILPLSLQGLDVPSSIQMPFHIKKISELSKHFEGVIESVSSSVGEEFSGYIKNVPPFFALLVDQSLSAEHSLSVLSQLRKDFSRLRDQGHTYAKLISNAVSFRDKNEIVKDWDDAWRLLYKGDFKPPQLMSRKISSSDVSKAILKPSSVGVSTVIQNVFDYCEERRSYKQFRLYSDLYSELDCIGGTKINLKSKFLVDLVNEL